MGWGQSERTTGEMQVSGGSSDVKTGYTIITLYWPKQRVAGNGASTLEDVPKYYIVPHPCEWAL